MYLIFALVPRYNDFDKLHPAFVGSILFVS